MRLRRTSPKLCKDENSRPHHTRTKSLARAQLRADTHTHAQSGRWTRRTHTDTVAAGTAAVPGGRKKRDDFGPTSDTVQVTIKHNVLYGDGETDDSCGATASSCCGFKLSGKNTTNFKRHLFVD
ncbi:zinc finger BED domain-containing protein 4-like [Xyrichtys novacula]|uniref:Zinc finger BED domain-containing protein 4-like n=1 Tax=Xyrichtys novacula TaxID=13765 RepID=A0AAV1FY65_XYRNO|nr:zinc finger BED domain-containing protein 4-like [Xyrichtys novacula]